MIHLNADCPHNGTAVAALREMYITGNYGDIAAEAARLREQGVTDIQDLVISVNEVMAGLELGTMTFADASALFESMMAWVNGHSEGEQRDILLCEILFLYICYADRLGYEELRDVLVPRFFDEIDPECLHAQNEYLVLQGVFAFRRGELGAALVYFTAGLKLVRDGDEPCMTEVVARYVARVYEELDMSDDASRVLASVGLPIDDESMVVLRRVPALPAR